MKMTIAKHTSVNPFITNHSFEKNPTLQLQVSSSNRMLVYSSVIYHEWHRLSTVFCIPHTIFFQSVSGTKTGNGIHRKIVRVIKTFLKNIQLIVLQKWTFLRFALKLTVSHNKNKIWKRNQEIKQTLQINFIGIKIILISLLVLFETKSSYLSLLRKKIPEIIAF